MKDKWYQYTFVVEDCVTPFTRGDIETFMYELCCEIGMIPIKYCDHEWPEGSEIRWLHGITGVLFIETSDITIHTCSDINTLVLQVFSCKDFDVDYVETITAEWFDGKVTQSNKKREFLI